MLVRCCFRKPRAAASCQSVRFTGAVRYDDYAFVLQGSPSRIIITRLDATRRGASLDIREIWVRLSAGRQGEGSTGSAAGHGECRGTRLSWRSKCLRSSTLPDWFCEFESLR